MSDDPWAHHRARIARAVRSDRPDEAEEARRDLRAARLADSIKRLVDTAPPLKEWQIQKLRHLLPPAPNPVAEQRATRRQGGAS